MTTEDLDWRNQMWVKYSYHLGDCDVVCFGGECTCGWEKINTKILLGEPTK